MLIVHVTNGGHGAQQIQILVKILLNITVRASHIAVLNMFQPVGLDVLSPCQVGVVHPIPETTLTMRLRKVRNVLKRRHAVHRFSALCRISRGCLLGKELGRDISFEIVGHEDAGHNTRACA